MSFFWANVRRPYHVGAGGIVYKETNGQRLYALLYRQPGRLGYKDASWHLPKGIVEDEEPLPAAARREVREEAGVEADTVDYLGAICRQDKYYPTKNRQVEWDKEKIPVQIVVHYFLMKYISGDGSGMDDEHDRLDWLVAEEAIKKLAAIPKQEDKIVGRAERYLELGEPA